MTTTKKVSIKKYILALVLTAFGIGFIIESGGQLYGVFYGVTFLLMAITSFLDLDTWIDHLNT